MVVAPVRAPQIQPEPLPRPRMAAREKALALAMVGLLFAGGVAVVAQTVRLNALGYELAKVKQEIASLERDNGRLELEVAELKDPARLARLAADRLSLVEPDAAHVERVPTAVVARARLTVAGQAEPAPAAAVRPGLWEALAEAFGRWWSGRGEEGRVASN